MNRRQQFSFLGSLYLIILVSCGQLDQVEESEPNPTDTAIVITNTATPTTFPTETPEATQTEIAFELYLHAELTAEDCSSLGLPEMACTGVFKNQQWMPFMREINQIEMVLVPTGCFQMGNDESLPEEQPVHQICIEKPFWIDRSEVTVSQFVDFLNGQPEEVDSYDRWRHVWAMSSDLIHVQIAKEGQSWYPLKGEDQRPLEHVTWIGATEYCAWREARLPTEAEWEFAARGPDNNLYPWGNEIIRDNIVIYNGKNPEVGSKPQGASWVGALDMSGSVFEWTSSIFKPYPYDAFDGREISLEEDTVSARVFRGSAWYHHPHLMWDNVTATARYDAPPDFANWYYGFRCAQSID